MTLQPELRKLLVRIAAVVVLAAGAGACSSIPDWVDPTTWIGGSDQDTSQDSGSDNAPTPDLASIPNKPAPPSTSDEQKQVSDSLAADRTTAQYSAEALKGDTEASAPPPPAAPPAEQTASNPSSAAPSSSAADQTAGEQAAAAPSGDGTASAAAPPATGASAAPAQQPAAEVASTEPSSPVAPPAPAAAAQQVAPYGGEDLGFEASKAPPLDPSVSRYVPRAILDKVEQSSGSPAAAPEPVKRSTDQSSANDRPAKNPLADNQHTDGSSGRPAARRPQAAAVGVSDMTSASYSPSEARRISIAYFPHDAAELTDEAKASVRAAAQAFADAGGTGFIRVVGHASSRTSDMPMARRLEVIFERSQNYAAAVAQELIRDGVPAEKVLIEAVGDSEPASSRSAPEGETGNRRAEIFM